MSGGIDVLLKNVKTWFEEQGEVGLGAAGSVRGSLGPGGTTGMDPTVQKEYYKLAVNAETQLYALMKNKNISFNKALTQMKKETSEMKIQNKLQREAKRRKEDILKMVNKQYKQDKKSTLLHKTAQKYVSKKGPGGGGPKGPKVPKGGTIGAAIGFGVGVAINTAKAVTLTFMDAMETAMRGGWQGVLQAAVNIVSKIASVFSETLGKVVGTIGSVLIQGYMILMGRAIAQTQASLRLAGLTGRAKKGKGGQAPEANINTFGGSIKLMREWTGAIAGVGVSSNALIKDFYRIGSTMGMTGQETATYFEAMLSSAQDSALAMKNMKVMMYDVSQMSKKAGISTTKLASWVSDAAVQARMLNVDFKSVSNTMRMLVDKQKTLAMFGVDLRSQGPAILKTLTGVAQSWDMATPAMVGMGMYADQYKKDTGKEMGVGRGYIASRYGIEAAKGFKMDKGRWGMGKGMTGAAAMRTPKMTADQLKYMQTFAVEQTAGIKDEGERMMAQKKILSEIFKITDEGAQTAIMTAKEGDFKKLAANKKLQQSTMSIKQINTRMLGMQTRSQNIQLMIYNIMKKVLAVLIHSFGVIYNILKIIAGGIMMTASIIKPGDWLKSTVSKDTWLRRGFDMAQQGMEGTAYHGARVAENVKKVVVGVKKVTDKVVKPAVTEVTTDYKPKPEKQHTGGPFDALTPYIAKYNEKLSLKEDEFVFAAGSSGFVSPEGPGEASRSGNSIQLIFNIENGTPEIILSKVRDALQYESPMG